MHLNAWLNNITAQKMQTTMLHDYYRSLNYTTMVYKGRAVKLSFSINPKLQSRPSVTCNCSYIGKLKLRQTKDRQHTYENNMVHNKCRSDYQALRNELIGNQNA